MKVPTKFKLGCLAFAISQSIVMQVHAQTASIIVDTNSDTRASDTCTLRAAILAANNDEVVDRCNPDGIEIDEIDFDSSLLNSTITLNSGLPSIQSNIVINGLGQERLAISGDNQHYIARVVDGGNLTVNDLTLTDGYGRMFIGGAFIPNGAISTYDATLTINDSTLSKNSGRGGVIYSRRSNISINDSTLSGNSGSNGGAIYSYASDISINKTTLSGNSAHFGGGINAHNSSISITNSTVSGNSANSDGGISANNSSISITNSTVSGNSATVGGGGVTVSYGTTLITNTVVSGNTVSIGANEIEAPVSDFVESPNSITTQNNVFGSNESTYSEAISGFTPNISDIVISSDGDGLNLPLNKIIQPLADNGGPTLTHSLAVGSPAIDAGESDACLMTDQRGEVRANSSADPCDIGSVEGVVSQETLFVIPLSNGKTVIFGL